MRSNTSHLLMQTVNCTRQLTGGQGMHVETNFGCHYQFSSGSDVSHYRLVPALTRVLKPFLNKTVTGFVETSYLPVIRLRDIMCHVPAVLKRNAGNELKRIYVITTSTSDCACSEPCI